jgi:hypothetical protein
MILVKSLIVLFLLLLFIHGFNYVKRKMIDPPPGGRYREGFTEEGEPEGETPSNPPLKD